MRKNNFIRNYYPLLIIAVGFVLALIIGFFIFKFAMEREELSESERKETLIKKFTPTSPLLTHYSQSLPDYINIASCLEIEKVKLGNSKYSICCGKEWNLTDCTATSLGDSLFLTVNLTEEIKKYGNDYPILCSYTNLEPKENEAMLSYQVSNSKTFFLRCAGDPYEIYNQTGSFMIFTLGSLKNDTIFFSVGLFPKEMTMEKRNSFIENMDFPKIIFSWKTKVE